MSMVMVIVVVTMVQGHPIYGAGGSDHAEIGSLEDALSALRLRQAFGAFSVKSYMQPCRAARQRLLQAARELNMDVVVEGGMAFYWNLNEIFDGHTTIEHSLPMAPLYNDVVRTPHFLFLFYFIYYYYSE
jgi:hypothetical protein